MKEPLSMPAGKKLGAYEIVEHLGSGGMGAVYRARDPKFRRDVAIKVLPHDFAKDPDRLQRFEQEAQAIGILNHPNILSVYDTGMADGSPYLVSEYVEGETLREKLASGTLTQRKAIDYALQLARGLSAAHDKGIVHRDLKPENLMIAKDGRLKILDFGLAKLIQNDPSIGPLTQLPTTPGTQPGLVLGTVGYMSPEQVRGKIADHRSDIFTFGSILYEMLTGVRAFRGETTRYIERNSSKRPTGHQRNESQYFSGTLTNRQPLFGKRSGTKISLSSRYRISSGVAIRRFGTKCGRHDSCSTYKTSGSSLENFVSCSVGSTRNSGISLLPEIHSATVCAASID
jgi:serine/threonine protein kinase